LQALQAAAAAKVPAVLLTVVAARGSTPREAGAKMVVTADGAHGTIGGGNLEFQCLALARAMLADPSASAQLRQFPLGPALGQCCGGNASVLFEPIRPPNWRIALFGAGHVGRALVGVLATLDCQVDWFDSRAAEFPPDLPDNATRHVTADPVGAVAGLPSGACVLVMTHDHALDLEIIAAALARSDLAFIGLIGSDTKRARFTSRLAKRGVAAEALRRLVCPIGVAGVGGKAPTEIAVAVAAQLLQIRDAMVHTPPTPAIAMPTATCADCRGGCA